MRASGIAQRTEEKANAGWFEGVNSGRLPWLMDDTQAQWGVNIAMRGGFPQTRPGFLNQLILPPGKNLQAFTFFEATLNIANVSSFVPTWYAVAMIDGIMYAVPFDTNGNLPFPVVSWAQYQIPNIQMSVTASFCVMEIAQKSTALSNTDNLSIVPTYNVLFVQDGTSNPGYWDGTNSGQTDPTDGEKPGTQIGLWMKNSGGRLWVSINNQLMAMDLQDPLLATERVFGQGRGDLFFEQNITGLTNSSGQANASNLLVYTATTTNAVLSSITDRDSWSSTTGFVTTLYANRGCIAGKSIAGQMGLLWWYSAGGLVSSDAAAASYLTSQIHYRDVEMARAKAEFPQTISGICSVAFESYLLVSVPANDTYNSQTMVLDTAVADELIGGQPPAWNGVWTGIRPVEWAVATINNQQRCMCASVDYMTLDGKSVFTIWEPFQSSRTDSYRTLQSNGTITTVENPIYCLFEPKQFGDGLGYRKFKYCEANLVEMGGGAVNLRMSFAGSTGPYTECYKQLLNATTDPTVSATVQKLANQIGPFGVQGRRVRSVEFSVDPETGYPVESENLLGISDKFSMLFEWCGRMGIESFRMFYELYQETSTGTDSPDETEYYNIISQDGVSYRILQSDP